MYRAFTNTLLVRFDEFIVKGDLNAPSSLFSRLKLNSWNRLGPFFIFIFAGPLALQLLFTVRPDFQMAKRLIVTAPVIFAFVMINAFSEELSFRSALLARLVPPLGKGQGSWLTSVLFGLAHWFGHPSGPTGVILAGLAGWIWAMSMLETKGFVWP